MTNDIFQEQLNALCKAYAERLPMEIKQIEETWAALLSDKWSEAGFKTLYRLIHTLAGSGATFGFDALSHSGHQLEVLLSSIINSGKPPTEEQRAETSALLTMLKQAITKPDQPDQPDQSPKADVKRPDEPEYILMPSERDQAPEPEPERENKLIFLVDDDPNLRQDLVLQISYFGYEVRAFSKPAELKAAVKQTTPAAIIMDIVFPEGKLSGTETISEIQQGRETPLPVIFISVYNNLEARLQAIRAGSSFYLTKPFDIGELIDKLDTLASHQAPAPYRILIVEDDSLMAALNASILQHAGMITQIVTDPLQVMQPLIEFRPDLILMDLHMPGCNGLELARVIRSQENYLSISIVFLSTETRLDKQLMAMRLGGDDFLTKPIQSEHLISSVIARAQRSRLLRSLMIRDSLTGLLNHARIKEQLEIEVARTKRQNGKLSFAMIDIDHFKAVNDTHGHLIGDQVLKSLSRLLQQRLRRTDIIGRYGGEEFAVVLVNTNDTTGVKVIDEIRNSFSKVRHQAEKSGEFYVSFSCGIAGFPKYERPGRLANAADKALYEAKREGRNRVVLASINE